MGLRGGGANSSLQPPFRRKGGAPVPLHPPGYGPDENNKTSTHESTNQQINHAYNYLTKQSYQPKHPLTKH